MVGQRNEDETIPLLDADLVEREIRHIETARMGLGGRAQQISLQVVNPRMVRTDDGPGAQQSIGLAAQGRAAMPAGVVEPLQNTLIIAHQKYPLVAQFKGTERPGARQ